MSSRQQSCNFEVKFKTKFGCVVQWELLATKGAFSRILSISISRSEITGFWLTPIIINQVDAFHQKYEVEELVETVESARQLHSWLMQYKDTSAIIPLLAVCWIYPGDDTFDELISRR